MRGRVERTAAVAATTVAALALVVVIGLGGMPGALRSAPSAAAATATAQPVAALSDGLTRVQTLQGVFVPDAPPGGARDDGEVVSRVVFAVSSNGDRYFDIRYRPDYREKQKEWRSYTTGSPHVAADDPGRIEAAGALTRQVMVVDAGIGLTQWKSWIVNPFTRKVIGVRYRYIGGESPLGAVVLGAPRSVQYVWLLSNVLSNATAARQPRVTVAETAYRGQPTYRAVVYGDDAKPAYEALIDRRYGVALRVTSLLGSRTLPYTRLVPFHLEELEVNRPLVGNPFVMRPDYRYAPQGFGQPKPSDTPDKYGMDFGQRPVPLADLARYTSSWTLLPTWMPAGYHLAQALRAEREWIWLTYRRGMEAFRVGTLGTDGRRAAQSSGFVFGNSDVQFWPALAGTQVSSVRAGALVGWPVGGDFTATPGWNEVSSIDFGVSGTLPAVELRRMLESLRPAKAGPHLPSTPYRWQAWLALAFAIAVTMTMALLWGARRRRSRAVGERPAALRVARLPLAGVALVLMGATLSWHRLYGSGLNYAVRGWHEPLAVITVTLALFAGTTAAWACLASARQSPSRRLVGPRFLTTLLGLFAVASTLMAAVYLPVQARFATGSVGMGWTGLGSLAAFLRGAMSPAPGPGLYLSLVGTLLIVVGGLRMRTRPTPAAQP